MIKTYLILIISFLFITPEQTHASYEEWGEFATAFLLPLTYEKHDAADFGSQPDPQDLKILEQLKPTIFVAPQGLVPIDFYKDYLPYCFLRDSETDSLINPQPTRLDLKRYERQFGYFLDYTGPKNLVGTPTAYARIYRENCILKLPGETIELPIIFAKYNFAFLASGLTRKMAWYKRLAVALLGDTDWWHELDIHGAVIVAATKQKGFLTPIALTLAQHNHFRTYLFGRDIPYPKDGHPEVSFALGSNEPYPLPRSVEPVDHPAVGNPSDFDFVISGKGFSVTAGWDVVYGDKAGAKHIKYRIRQLPDRDPLYVSWIPLGEKKGVLGRFGEFYRTGPPGIDLMTWPEISTYSDILQFWFVDDGDEKAASLFKTHFKDLHAPDIEPIRQYNSSRFATELLKLHPTLKP
jgi:hypothetical protein